MLTIKRVANKKQCYTKIKKIRYSIDRKYKLINWSIQENDSEKLTH